MRRLLKRQLKTKSLTNGLKSRLKRKNNMSSYQDKIEKYYLMDYYIEVFPSTALGLVPVTNLFDVIVYKTKEKTVFSKIWNN